MIVGGVILCSLGVLTLAVSLLTFVTTYETWTTDSPLDMTLSFLLVAYGLAMMIMSCIAIFVGISLISGTL